MRAPRGSTRPCNHRQYASAPAAGTSRPEAASGEAPHKAASTPARPATAPAHASNRPAKAAAGSVMRSETPYHARPGPAHATIKKKTPTIVPKPVTPPSGTKADHQEKTTTSRVVPQKVEDEHRKPTAPIPFPNKPRQDEPDDAAKQRESRKRRLEVDKTAATQPVRPKMRSTRAPDNNNDAAGYPTARTAAAGRSEKLITDLPCK
ncbi:hypothetical protein ACJJTC_000334 [Scirpophaga incertulas]